MFAKRIENKGLWLKVVFRILVISIVLAPSTLGAQTRTSTGSGLFNNLLIWDCLCIPAAGNNIVIENGHTITLFINTTVNNVEVKNGGTLNTSNRRLDVDGNIILNGVITGSGDVRMQGSNKNLSGTGEFSLSGNLDMRTGNKTILAGSDLEFTGTGATQARAITVTNKGSYSSLDDINGTNASSIWINDTNAVVNAGRVFMGTGVLNAQATGNVIKFSRAGNQTIVQPASSFYYHMIVSGSGNKDLDNSLIILGNLELQSGNFRSQGSDFELRGNFTNTGATFNEGNDLVIFGGSNNQVLSAPSQEVFNDLQINKPAGTLTLGVDINVSNSLTLTSGLVVTGSNKVLLGTTTVLNGNLQRTGGHIVGNFERWLGILGSPHLFPVGTLSNYRPASISFDNITNGRLLVSFVQTLPGSNGLPLGDGVDTVRHTFTEGYWSLTTSSGLASTSFDLNLEAGGFTSYTINPSSRLLTRANSSSAWQASGSHVAAASSVINRNNVTILPAEFCAGDTTGCLIPPPATSAITGSDSVCAGATGVPYSVTNTIGSTYSWTVTGGTQSGGGSSNSITVDWSATGQVGTVSVLENNGCEFGDLISKSVNVHAIPPNAITGLQTVQEFQNGVAYSVTARPGYTFNWTISGGSQASGTNTANITVNWSSAGTGSVTVTATNVCGTSGGTQIPVDILSTIQSVATGNWSNSATWSCSCAPGASSNVVINTGHTVTLTANSFANYLEIESGAVLNTGSNTMILTGDFINNGSYSGSNRLSIGGTLNTVSGTGSYASYTGEMRFLVGIHYIATGTVISKSAGGDIDVRANTTVFNNGSVTVSDNIAGANATTSVWHNMAGSTLRAGLDILNNGVLYATYTGNKVIYARTGNNVQNIKNADGGKYYHLEITGDNLASDKRLSGNTEVLGNLNISLSTFDASATNHSFTIHGNWNNLGGSFDARSGIVYFKGTNQVINHSSEEVFSDLSVQSTSKLLLRTNLRVLDDFSISSGSVFDVNDTSNYTVSFESDFQNSGSFLARKGLVKFEGNLVDQTLDGSTRFYNLSLDKLLSATMNSGDFELEGTLTLINGNLHTEDRLTLISDSLGTARIAEITGGAISDNITVQRYLATDVTYWRMLSSPVSGTTIQDWHEHFTTSGFTGADNPTASFKSIQRYNQSVSGLKSQGYYGVTSTANSIAVGEGYFVWTDRKTGSGSYTIDLVGSANTGNKSLPVTYNVSAGASEDGWNLVGNPYPSAINWTDADWTKTGLNNAVYVYDPVAKQYASYVNGMATNGGSPIIPSSQAFWVQADSASPSLQAKEGVKTALDQTFFQTSPPDDHLRISITGANMISDETVIRANANSTKLYDRDYDARKIFSTYPGAPGLSSWLGGVEFSINTLPAGPIDEIIPVTAKVKVSGNYTLQLNPETINGTLSCLIFKDKYLNISFPVQDDTTYTCYLYDTTSAPRFEIILGKEVNAQVQEASCPGSFDGIIAASGYGSGPWDYTWTNQNDSVIRQSTSSFMADSLKGIESGIYKVSISNSGICGSHFRRVELDIPDNIISEFETSADVVDIRSGTEMKFENLSTEQARYEWNFGDGNSSTDFEPSHLYTSTGIFEVSLVVRKNICSDTSYKSVTIVDYTGKEKVSESTKEFMIYSNGNRLFVRGANTGKKEIQIQITTSEGRIVERRQLGSGAINEVFYNRGPASIWIVNVMGDGVEKSASVFIK